MRDKVDMLQLGLDALREAEAAAEMWRADAPEQDRLAVYENVNINTQIGLLRLALAQGVEQRRMAEAQERMAAALTDLVALLANREVQP